MPQLALISQLSKDRIDWKGDYRVVRKYRNPAYGHIPETLELCLMDRQGFVYNGSKIQAMVSNFLLDKFDPLIEEGELLSVTQFSVIDNAKVFPMADCPYKIMFQKQTVVQPIVRKTFPNSLFHFKSFNDIISGGHKEDNPLFVVIGCHVYCGIPIVKILEDYLFFFEMVNVSNVFWWSNCAEQECSKEVWEFPILIMPRRFTSWLIWMKLLNIVASCRVVSILDLMMDELENPCAVVMSVQQLKESDVPIRVWIVASISEVIYDWD